jgi:UDP-N-acetylglucosamine 4-epimerase
MTHSKQHILITGGAGFIGSNLAEALLNDNRVTAVRVMDNLETGYEENIKEFYGHPKFEFYHGDIRNFEDCLEACKGIDIVSHQAALGSVPRSINNPLASHSANATGTLNMFRACVESNIKRIVFASSSSVYGDNESLPKVEHLFGKPLSPYAATKQIGELYADVFAKTYNMHYIGLRYFNIFGPKQNIHGPYAAVIPLFITKILKGESPTINGDGTQSRDFTFVQNAVQANILALFNNRQDADNQIYNIACGDTTSLNAMYTYLKKISGSNIEVNYGPQRDGDIKDSLADISKATQLLGYTPIIHIHEGLDLTFDWFKDKHNG